MIEIKEKKYTQENYYNKDIYEKYKEDIELYIKGYKQEDYSQILKKDKRTNIVNIFSEMRANIIKWYPFKENGELLEIGANYGEVTQGLVKKLKEVTAIEFSKTKVSCIQKRLKDYNNLKIILTTKLNNCELEKKYDYITIIGTAEYAQKLGFENLEDMLKWTKKYLKEDGTILLAIDNKFGVKYLAGSTRNKEEVPLANYKNYIKKDYKLYGKTELEDIIKNVGLSNYKFYYPLPNYNITDTIYTNEYLPKNISYNIYYREDEEILFNEITFMQEVIKNKQFNMFCNSYLIEISPKCIKNINFVKYSNMRKEKYKIITKIEKNNVTKEAYKTISKEHIDNIKANIDILKKLGFKTIEKYNNGQINSEYIKNTTMEEYLQSILDKNDINKFEEELNKWYIFLKEKLLNMKENNIEKDIFEKYNIEIEKEKKAKLNITKYGFMDLLFENVFYSGQEYIIFDQEWREEGIPLEYILYRALKKLFKENADLKECINKLYEKYNIKSYIDVFEEIDKIWQEEIIDEEIFGFYSEKWSRLISIEDIKYRYNQELGKIYKERDELANEIKQFKSTKIYKYANMLNRRKKDE
ncbi:MAG: methyltransferase domain-containing protein [Clostridia bacterium]|nr:methyltransferase domain-containing protein [Clostridia bacterium]